MEDCQDDRRIGQSPLTLRTKSEVQRGDPGAASSSTAMPALILEENPTATAEFNDKSTDHKWIVLPAMSDKKEEVAIVAEIASRLPNHADSPTIKARCVLHSTQTLW